MKTLFLIVLCSVLGSACATDSVDEPARYSCLIRFRCVGSGDILARQYFTCAMDPTEAVDNTQEASLGVAADRCGEGQWAWTWATCDEQPIANAAAQCETAK